MCLYSKFQFTYKKPKFPLIKICCKAMFTRGREYPRAIHLPKRIFVCMYSIYMFDVFWFILAMRFTLAQNINVGQHGSATLLRNQFVAFYECLSIDETALHIYRFSRVCVRVIFEPGTLKATLILVHKNTNRKKRVSLHCYILYYILPGDFTPLIAYIIFSPLRRTCYSRPIQISHSSAYPDYIQGI